MQIEVLPPYTPLVNDRAVAFFEEIVRPDFVVCEFGSGKSTIWFARHCASVVSIENDPRWFEAVGAKLREVDLWAECWLVEHDQADKKMMHKSREYVGIIEHYPDDHFDLVFVDGAARPWCIRDARAKIKPGGWLVADDLGYNPVARALHFLDGWECTKFRGRVDGAIDGNPRNNTTGFFRKPEDA